MGHLVHKQYIRYVKVTITSYFLISDNLTKSIIQGPLGLIFGFLFGILWGLLIRYIPERQDVSVIFWLAIYNRNILVFLVLIHRFSFSDLIIKLSYYVVFSA
jgi:hypothetical protein